MPKAKSYEPESLEIKVVPPSEESYPLVQLSKAAKSRLKIELDATTDPDMLAIQIGRMVIAQSKTLSAWVDPLATNQIECRKCGGRNPESNAICKWCGWDLANTKLEKAATNLAADLKEKYPGYWDAKSIKKPKDRKRIFEKERGRLKKVSDAIAANSAWVCWECVTVNEPKSEKCVSCKSQPSDWSRLSEDRAFWRMMAFLNEKINLGLGFGDANVPFETDLEVRTAKKRLRGKHSSLFSETAKGKCDWLKGFDVTPSKVPPKKRTLDDILEDFRLHAQTKAEYRELLRLRKAWMKATKSKDGKGFAGIAKAFDADGRGIIDIDD